MLPAAQQALVGRLRAGDRDAFTEIFHLYTEKAIDQACRMLDDREQSMDIAQDVLLYLWVNRERLDSDLNLGAYIRVAVRNACLKVIRHGKVKDRVFDQIEKRIWGEPVNSDSTEHRVRQRELQNRLKQAIQGLPDLAQEIYRLSREEHLSHREIAEKLSMDPKAVENQLSRALKKIRTSLADLLPLILLFLGGK